MFHVEKHTSCRRNDAAIGFFMKKQVTAFFYLNAAPPERKFTFRQIAFVVKPD